jgi:hypothetical protein
MNWAIYYDQSTGEINSYCSFSAQALALLPPINGQMGAFVEQEPKLPGWYDPLTGSCSLVPERPSAAHAWNWGAKEWASTAESESANVAAQRIKALSAIDTAAGQTRLKYITSVPGQAETYQRKEQQAREWQAAGFAGDPPPFVNAEAIALGIDPQAIALNIIALADYWSNIKGPEIEATRRKWKVAIEAAGQDVTAINAALASGIDALDAL